MEKIFQSFINWLLAPIAKALLGAISWMLQRIYGTGKINSDIFNGLSSAGFEGIFGRNSILAALTGAFMGIGIAIATVFFVINLTELAKDSRLTIDTFMHYFSKICVSIAVIIATPEFIRGGFALSEWIGQKIANLQFGTVADTVTTTVFTETSIDQFQHDDMGVFIGALLILLIDLGIVWLLTSAVNIIIVICAAIVFVSRMLELGIRCAFLPISLGMWADDGWHGSAGRAVKRIFGLFVQGPAVYLLLVIYKVVSASGVTSALSKMNASAGGTVDMTAMVNQLLGSSLINLVTAFLLPIAAGIATIGMLFKISQVTSEVFGA